MVFVGDDTLFILLYLLCFFFLFVFLVYNFKIRFDPIITRKAFREPLTSITLYRLLYDQRQSLGFDIWEDQWSTSRSSQKSNMILINVTNILMIDVLKLHICRCVECDF